MKPKSTRGCGKSLLFDYYYYIKYKRSLLKTFKQQLKKLSFDDYMDFIDYLISYLVKDR